MQKNIWIAAKYLRLSIEDGDKAESESIVNQSILIDNYMKSTSDITIVETFKDDGFSGTDFKRPGFQAMLKAIENKEINCIIVKDLSRFGREHIDVDRYIQKVFPQLGVRFIAINDNYDSETANITDTHLVLPVKSFVNDTYCRQNSQKVRSHLSAKRNIGEYVGNYVSYGYKKCDADKSQIEIDPVAAKHVRDIFNWKMEGMSNQLIADKLNELGVLAPADYKRATGVNFKSSFQTHLTSRWSAVAIIRILKNPIYYGVLQQGKSQRINYKVKVQRALPKEEWVIFENHHEGIVTKEEYETVQMLLAKDTRPLRKARSPMIAYGSFSRRKDERKKKITNYWAKRSDSFMEQRRAELHSDMADKWLKEIGTFLPDGKLRILDVGCGAGFFSILLAKLGHEVTGIDLTPDMIIHSRELAKEENASCTFEVMDAENPDFPDGTFDVIVSRNLTWTLPDAARAYKEWIRVLKTGGILINADANYGADDFSDTADLPANHAHFTVGDAMMQECEEIKRQLPISSYVRPAWDLETLGKLGINRFSIDLGISSRIYTKKDEFYNPTPMFLICGEKNKCNN